MDERDDEEVGRTHIGEQWLVLPPPTATRRLSVTGDVRLLDDQG